MGLVALRTGGVFAGTVLFAASMLLIAMAIVAFVGIGAPRAYAIGFLVPVTFYATCVTLGGSDELEPYDGKLPTAFILRYAHQQLVTRSYVDLATGKVIPNYDPAAAARSGAMPGGMGMGGMGGMGPMLVEIPDRGTFMLLAHTLLGLTLSWLGAQFAMRVYQLQHPELSRSQQGIPPKPPAVT